MSGQACSNCGRIGLHMPARGWCGACYKWFVKYGTVRPYESLPPTLSDERADRLTTVQVCRSAGISFRQLDYWIRTGRYTPEIQCQGSGTARWFTNADVQALTRIRERLDWGMTVDAAVRSEDPPVPAPQSLVAQS